MAIHDATVSLTSTAFITISRQTDIAVEYIHFNTGVPVTGAPQNANEYVYFNPLPAITGLDVWEPMFGYQEALVYATASLTAAANVTSVFYSGAGTANSLEPTTPGIPSGTDLGDFLLLFHNAKYYAGILGNNTNDADALGMRYMGYSTVSGYYGYTGSTYGVDTGVTNITTFGGMVLVTGPTGSGKSTKLASIIDVANRNRKDHIITVEDPIEFVHQSQACIINQREIGIHTKTFSSALRGALREDPDIILVGEMRDLETISLAVEAATTGHLVFSTLHTTGAVKTVDRVIEVFPAQEQAQIRSTLADGLRAVISQTLFKRIDKVGRIVALEILIATPGVRNLIREGKSHQIPSMIQTGKKFGMTLLDDSIMELFKRGAISAEEAYAKSNDKARFRPLLRGAPADFTEA